MTQLHQLFDTLPPAQLFTSSRSWLKLTSVLLLASLLQSCYNWRSYATRKDKSEWLQTVADLPSEVAPNPKNRASRQINLFTGNNLPVKPYLQTDKISSSGKESFAQLSVKLQQTAARAGYDAVIYVIRKESSQSNNKVRTISGTGVKYLKNLEHLANTRSHMKVYNIKDNGEAGKLMANIRFDFSGNYLQEKRPSKTRTNVYEEYIAPYDLHHLMQEQDKWAYTSDARGNILTRRNENPNSKIWKCKCWYDGKERLRKLKVEWRYVHYVYEIMLRYNRKGQLIEKTVVKSQEIILKEQLFYDKEGRHEESVYLKQNKTGQLEPAWFALISYYDLNDLAKSSAPEP